MMLSLWTHNNPLLAPYMVISATVIISIALAYIGFRVGYRRVMLSKAPKAMKTELRALQSELRGCYGDIASLRAEKTEAKVKIEEAADLLARAERTLSKAGK